MHFLIIFLRKLTIRNKIFKKCRDCEKFLEHEDDAVEWCEKCKNYKNLTDFGNKYDETYENY